MRKLVCCIALVLTVLIFSGPMVFAQNTADGDGKIKPNENSEEELAKAAQNPVADINSTVFISPKNPTKGK